MHRAVLEKLGYYVYLYVDPRNERIFYVGKGRGKRALAHQKRNARLFKSDYASELRKLGVVPRVDVLKWGLSEKEAFLVESAAIELLGMTGLVNKVRGHNSVRSLLSQVMAELNPIEARIVHPVVLINIARGYLPTMTAMEVYDRTRSAWKIKPKKHQPEYAFTVFRGIIREVFEIAERIRGGATMRMSDMNGRNRDRPGRSEFVGRVAEELIRKKYLHRSVVSYLPRGAQNPVRFVNC